MKCLLLLIPTLLSVAAFSGCGANAAQPGASGQPSFRVRSDFAATLNSDQGWAGALNENVSVNADKPFRVRFEVERPAAPTGSGQFRLQVRRNQGDWTDVDAHDFPHPERDLTVRFREGGGRRETRRLERRSWQRRGHDRGCGRPAEDSSGPGGSGAAHRPLHAAMGHDRTGD